MFKKIVLLIWLFTSLLTFHPLYGQSDNIGQIVDSASETGILAGLIIDHATHLPIKGAHVEVLRGRSVVASVLSDENGMYSFAELPPKLHLIKVKSVGFQTGLLVAIPIVDQTLFIDFDLIYLPGYLTGQVINSVTKESVANAKIELLEDGFAIDSVQTGEDGSYVIADVNPREYIIRISAVNYQETAQALTLLTNQSLTAHFSIEPFGDLFGQVLHAFTSEPIAGTSLEIWHNQALLNIIHSDEKGFFNLKGIGDCHIVVRAPHFHDLEKGVHILPMQSSTLDFSLVCIEPKPIKKISGKVIHKRYAHQVNRIHRLKWIAGKDPSITAYRIYRKGKPIGQVSATDPLVFKDQWRKEKPQTYSITAVNAFGQESTPVMITID